MDVCIEGLWENQGDFCFSYVLCPHSASQLHPEKMFCQIYVRAIQGLYHYHRSKWCRFLHFTRRVSLHVMNPARPVAV